MKRFRHWNPEVAVSEGPAAEGSLDGLLATDSARWAPRVENDTELQTWGVAWVALERAQASLAQEAIGRARELALLAATVAGSLGSDYYHPESIADLKALAHATAAAASSGDPGVDLRQVGAAIAALHQGSGEEEIAREVVELLSRAFHGARIPVDG